MTRPRRARIPLADRALPRRLRALEPPPVPTVSQGTLPEPPPVSPPAEDPTEEAARRMVEAAYT